MNKSKKGLLIINLGTPKSPKNGDVFTYLNEFLTDGRVIDMHWFKRQLLVRGIIVPFRYKNSAATYRKIWDKQKGSPLMYHSLELMEKLKKRLPENFVVELAMRYQEPSIKNALDKLKDKNIDELIIFPMYPQYASSSTGTVLQKTMEELAQWNNIPHTRIISHYYDNPGYISAFAKKMESYGIDNYDHVLFSYHGVPLRHIKDGDLSGEYCYKNQNFECCTTINLENNMCYRAQCVATTRAIVAKLDLPEEKFTIAFQSRLGKEEWVKPYASETIQTMAQSGKKKLLVVSPAFTADCLETIYEIGVEYAEEFVHHGGEKLQLVESLNDDDLWVDAIVKMVNN